MTPGCIATDPVCANGRCELRPAFFDPGTACRGLPDDPRIAAARRSFGECRGECDFRLIIDRADATGENECDTVMLEIRGWFPGPCLRTNSGVLTPQGHRLARELAKGLVGEQLDDVYGCPDCADGGASSVTLRRGGVSSSHQYECGSPPDRLTEVDEFTSGLIDALSACASHDNILVDQGCTPR
jgi:hypothetical protein